MKRRTQSSKTDKADQMGVAKTSAIGKGWKQTFKIRQEVSTKPTGAALCSQVIPSSWTGRRGGKHDPGEQPAGRCRKEDAGIRRLRHAVWAFLCFFFPFFSSDKAA